MIKRTSDKALLENLINKYGKNKLVRAINEMDIFTDRNKIDRIVRRAIDKEITRESEFEYQVMYDENPEDTIMELFYVVCNEFDNQGIDSRYVPASIIRSCIKNYLNEIFD